VEQKDLDYFKKLLTQWLDELLGRAGDTVVGLIDSEAHLSDPLDQAVLDAERIQPWKHKGAFGRY